MNQSNTLVDINTYYVVRQNILVPINQELINDYEPFFRIISGIDHELIFGYYNDYRTLEYSDDTKYYYTDEVKEKLINMIYTKKVESTDVIIQVNETELFNSMIELYMKSPEFLEPSDLSDYIKGMINKLKKNESK